MEVLSSFYEAQSPQESFSLLSYVKASSSRNVILSGGWVLVHSLSPQESVGYLRRGCKTHSFLFSAHSSVPCTGDGNAGVAFGIRQVWDGVPLALPLTSRVMLASHIINTSRLNSLNANGD